MTAERSLRILNVGVSSQPTCGVRDYARVLGEALTARGASVSTVWRERHREVRGEWLAEVGAEAARDRPDWILWHYSVFEYGRHGVPYDVPLIARRLRRLGPRVALVAHEYALPFGRRGLRGFVHATSQHAVLGAVVRRADAALVTVEARRERLARFGRPVAAQPVFSNLPAVVNGHVDRGTIGVFGYGTEDFDAGLVAEAAAALGEDVRIVLLGAPGPGSAGAQRWQRAFAAAGQAGRLELTGLLSPEDAARRLASLEVILFPDRLGPSARKTTLAAALAAGRAVVAVEGPEAWDEVVEAEAVELAPPDADEIARRLAALLADPERRAEQGRRAAAFYSRRLAPEHAAAALVALLEEAGG